MAKRVRTTVRRKDLLREINTGPNQKVTKTLIANAFRANVNAAQKEMIREFESHPVTQELDAGPGPRTNNPSGLLGGYGDLFSFIGFKADSNPTQAVREILSKNITYNVKNINLFGRYLVSFDVPDKKEIYEKTKTIPWNPGRSWVDAIEFGISGLGNYLNTTSGPKKGSFSGFGFQVKANLRGGKFQNTTYISEILRNLRKNIREGV